MLLSIVSVVNYIFIDKNPHMIVRMFLYGCLSLAGCTTISEVGVIEPPQAALDCAFNDAEDPELFYNARVPENWWLLFDNAELSLLIEEAHAKNPSLQAAFNSIDASAAIASRVRSSLYPYLSWGADASRQKLSTTGVIPFETGPKGSGTPVIVVPATPGGASPIPEYFSLYETELNFKYEFDFWNKNRNTFYAAIGKVQANIAEYEYAKLELGIAVAKAYYDLQISYGRLKNAEKLEENRKNYYLAVKERVGANIDTVLSLQSAEFVWIDAKDRLLEVQADIAVNKYQLQALLAGRFDEMICPIAIKEMPLPRIPLPQDLPLNLISKRADITAQLWLIESAGRQIEVAKAGFYPNFNLMGFFGYQTIHFPELFKWPSSFYNIDPAVSLPIFDGGRLQADLDGSQIQYNLAILQYNQLVLDAAEEVLEALAVLKIQAARLDQMERKVQEQTEYNQLIALKIQHHIGNQLDLLTSEGNLLLAEDQEWIARGKMYHSLLNLIHALGGGYDNSCR